MSGTTGKGARLWTRLLIAAFLLALAGVELALADRKYGLFTGGFGQSQPVDTWAERAWFALAYAAAMAVSFGLFWALMLRLFRRARPWVPLYHFIGLGGGLFVVILALQYQLHSYFSDSVGFALLANLGGGSLVDAARFAANEIVLGVVALLALVAAYILVYRLLRRRIGDVLVGHCWRAPWRLVVVAGLILALTFFWRPADMADARNGLNRTLAWGSLRGLADKATDFDRDGYGLAGHMPDPHPLDAARHPLALDIPGNGVDEDGLGGDLRLIDLPRPLPETLVTGAHPNLIVVVMESLRHDVIGKRVNGRAVAPHLEALARQGSVIAPSYSHIGFTTASLKSLFSGSLAPVAGMPSLFTELKKSGYRIGVYSGQPEDFGDISAVVGMRANADHFVDGMTLKDKRAFSNAAPGSILVDERHILDAFARDYAAQGSWAAPQFLYFNFQSTHFPYDHDGLPRTLTRHPVARAEIGAARREDVAATYWNAAAYADARLGELIDRLKAAGVWDNSVLLVTGDHGESLFEDGFLGHGHIINDRQYGTFLVTNRPGLSAAGAIGLSDYRAIVHALMAGRAVRMPDRPVLMIVGELDEPTQIGIAQSGGRITSLRVDTGIACMVERGECANIADISGDFRDRVNLTINIWGTARWQARR